jgi:hypothetical protein
MADASYFPYQTGVPVKLINLGPDAAGSSDKYAFAMALSASGEAQGVYQVSKTPAVTAGPAAYAPGDSIGGIITFDNVLADNYGYGGILESITVRFKGSTQTAAMNVAIFTQPPIGTFSNDQPVVIDPADSQYLLGIYQLTTASSVLGTHTIYNLDGIAKALVGSNVTTPVNYAGNLYVVVVPGAGVTLASTSDMIVTLGILGG